MTGLPLILAFVLAVVLMIVAISKFKVHPFLAIMAPMMESLGLASPVMSALTVMAIGAGAMTVSHANDSYFWVVTNFGGMTPDQGYKTLTLLTLIMGIASIIGIFLVSLFF